LSGDVIGRESELAILHHFLDSIPTGPSALLLSGDPGIGKTTVWKQGLAGAIEHGYRTLSCSPVEAETRLSYAVLGDLVGPVLDESLPTLPEPQRAGLEVALLRSPRTGGRRRPASRLAGRPGCIRAVASTTPVTWPSTTRSGWICLRDELIGLMTRIPDGVVRLRSSFGSQIGRRRRKQGQCAGVPRSHRRRCTSRCLVHRC
jgi:AAA ATPase domain